MVTTIQVTEQVKDTLDTIRVFEKETYNEVIEWLLEDYTELSEETKKSIEEAEEQIKAGKCKTHAEVGKELGFI